MKSALGRTSYDVAFDISAYTTASLLPVVEALDGRIGRFVFCSTTSVYAPSEVVPIDEDFALFRTPEASQYARDKIECEDLLLGAYSRGFPMTILRPPYVYGPDNYIAEREFSYFARLAQGRKVVIPENPRAPTMKNNTLCAHFDGKINRFHCVSEPQIALPNIIRSRLI